MYYNCVLHRLLRSSEQNRNAEVPTRRRAPEGEPQESWACLKAKGRKAGKGGGARGGGGRGNPREFLPLCAICLHFDICREKEYIHIHIYTHTYIHTDHGGCLSACRSICLSVCPSVCHTSINQRSMQTGPAQTPSFKKLLGAL